ncbi:hypothetical protein [Encephalitozoon cuniculi GB-M1]|uniref:UPF0328 protein ECU06_0030/ECU06_1690/ECU11_0020 n=1 Tax=Encephalitozoon cuniculi (strain GB-M1) TaxID=284813 RepID=Y603_ENCCU|nr:uncharacterized protein ECU06_0030 [Encephalitozoon cuniculi GB-M1]NP_585926.1 uncharacterized protein ECU06_1690 [Encephalitozoon cuniculi GB-M1]NP_586308.1 uncharacterized protein ECU11_0020 [Encephalitozoon cuniculi GB-M1]Q8STJ4.1 RecName: Full=UPF0328 protein ECU06_0030/ECU06_1690/ECU11_0020 [Encephalitozoon cuniculi GB-M1]CAD25363.1 hypothetical protein [Encephalitozoon cuniculi GB-M1]CAD25530.1 hypothetical protein [Encephalitozoon cuniculi GB-M1]CAD25912.1 hypothetical protein [Ence
MVRHSKNILPKTTNPNPESNRYPPHPADPSHPSRYHLHLQAHHLRSPLLSASAENRRRDPQNLSTTKATSPSTHQSPILPDDIHSILPFAHMNITHTTGQHTENSIRAPSSTTILWHSCQLHSQPSSISSSTKIVSGRVLFSDSSPCSSNPHTQQPSIFSCPTLAGRKLESSGSIFLSTTLPSFIVSIVYLLSVSCRLVPGQTAFTNTNSSVLIDIPILLCSVGSLSLILKEPKYRSYLAIVSPTLSC